MPIRRIRQLGDPILRTISAPLDAPASAGSTLADLRDTLHEFQRSHGFGRGISAVQIGVVERLIYIEFEGVPYCLANPVYEHQSRETFRLWDDCFSFPDLLVYLERAETVRISYLDAEGLPRLLTASGAFSELLQHEMDHLDGVLAVDRAIGDNGLATREEWKRLTGVTRQ